MKEVISQTENINTDFCTQHLDILKNLRIIGKFIMNHQMKIICKIFILLCIITQFVIAQSLKYSVTEPEKEYLVAEPIDIGIGVKNITTSIPTPKFFESVRIRVFNENGIELPYRGPTGDWISPYSKELKPEEEAYKITELNEFWGTRFTPVVHVSYFKPGKYSLLLYFRQPDMSTDSLSLSFNVVSPTGDELTVYNGFINTLSLIGTSQYSHERFVNELRSLADNHPNSVYTPYFLHLLHLHYSVVLKDEEKALSIEKEIIEKCTKFGRSFNYIEDFLRRTNSKSEKAEILKRLKEKTKNSVLDKYIDLKLKQESELK